MAAGTTQRQDKFIIRLPDGMRDRINEAAKINGRTMTAEIVTRLRMSFETEGKSPSSEPVRPLEEEVADLKSEVRLIKKRLNEMDKRNDLRLPDRKR